MADVIAATVPIAQSSAAAPYVRKLRTFEMHRLDARSQKKVMVTTYGLPCERAYRKPMRVRFASKIPKEHEYSFYAQTTAART